MSCLNVYLLKLVWVSFPQTVISSEYKFFRVNLCVSWTVASTQCFVTIDNKLLTEDSFNLLNLLDEGRLQGIKVYSENYIAQGGNNFFS